MKLIALTGSMRRGNSEISARYIANKLNADLEILRIANMNIKPCKACYACIFGEKCKIDDDVYFILEEIKKGDVILISSPVYWLDSPGKIKAFIDRCFMAIPYFEDFKEKKGAIVYFYGFEELRGWASTTYNLMLRCIGIEPLIIMPIHSPLPGEVLEKKSNLDIVAEVLKNGKRVVLDGQCPICLSETFKFKNGFECSLCGSKFNDRFEVIEKSERFSLDWMINHYDELRKFKDVYIEKRSYLKDLIDKYIKK